MIMNCARDVNGDKDSDFEYVTPISINYESGLLTNLAIPHLMILMPYLKVWELKLNF